MTDKVNCIYQLTDGTIPVGSDSGLWIEPSIDLSELIVEQNGLWIKGVFQASNRVIWYRSDQVILSCNGQSWIKHGHVKLATSWAVVGLRAGLMKGWIALCGLIRMVPYSASKKISGKGTLHQDRGSLM